MGPVLPRSQSYSEQQPLSPSPATWKEYAVKWRLPWFSCAGYLCLGAGLLILPGTAIKYGKTGAMNCAVLITEGAITILSSTAAATIAKVADAAKTAYLYGWKEAKANLREAVSSNGYILRTFLPNVPQMLDEGLNIAREGVLSIADAPPSEEI